MKLKRLLLRRTYGAHESCPYTFEGRMQEELETSRPQKLALFDLLGDQLQLRAMQRLPCNIIIK